VWSTEVGKTVRADGGMSGRFAGLVLGRSWLENEGVGFALAQGHHGYGDDDDDRAEPLNGGQSLPNQVAG
jgi:hypothetical protein